MSDSGSATSVVNDGDDTMSAGDGTSPPAVKKDNAPAKLDADGQQCDTPSTPVKNGAENSGNGGGQVESPSKGSVTMEHLSTLVQMCEDGKIAEDDDIDFVFPWPTVQKGVNEFLEAKYLGLLLKREYGERYRYVYLNNYCMKVSSEAEKFTQVLALNIRRNPKTENINRALIVALERDKGEDGKEGKIRMKRHVDLRKVKTEPSGTKHKGMECHVHQGYNLTDDEWNMVKKSREQEVIVIDDDNVTTVIGETQGTCPGILEGMSVEQLSEVVRKVVKEVVPTTVTPQPSPASTPPSPWAANDASSRFDVGRGTVTKTDSMMVKVKTEPGTEQLDLASGRNDHFIRELQQYVSAPSYGNRYQRAVLMEPELKMETESDLDSEVRDYSPEELLRKERILFRTSVTSLLTVLKNKCRSPRDITMIEDTLFSLDRTLQSGVNLNLDSFFNSIAAILADGKTSLEIRNEVANHIATQLNDKYLSFLEHFLVEKRQHVYKYLLDICTPGVRPDAYLIALTARYLERCITIIGINGYWKSDEASRHDIVLAHLGSCIFVPTAKRSRTESMNLTSPMAREWLQGLETSKGDSGSVHMDTRSEVSDCNMNTDDVYNKDDNNDINVDDFPQFHGNEELEEAAPFQVHSSVMGNVYSCRVHPTMMFANKEELVRHIKKHTDEFVCGECRRSFASKYNLQAHVSSFHEKTIFPCKIRECNKSFSSKGGMQKHYNREHKWPCERCKDHFAFHEDLDRHICKVLEGNRCVFCKKQFKAPETCRRHAEDVCLSNPQVLKLKYPYNCQNCGDSFTDSATLDKHNAGNCRNFTKGNIYACNKCGINFGTREEANDHKKEKH